jgi:hypothetical protein
MAVVLQSMIGSLLIRVLRRARSAALTDWATISAAATAAILKLNTDPASLYCRRKYYCQESIEVR